MRGFRVGVVGPLTPFGKRVRSVLEARAFPVVELKLFELGSHSGTLTRFEDEIVITQPIDPDLFPYLDVVFWGSGGDDRVAEMGQEAARQGVLSLLPATLGAAAGAVAAGVNAVSTPPETRLVAAPGAAAILLGAVLAPLTASFAVEHACATVLIPAGDAGEAGIEELHQQVVHVMNFRPPPTAVFSEQLAFNLMSIELADEEPPALIGKHAAQIAGLASDVAVSLVRAPVFHGYAASIWVRLSGESPGPEAVDAAWQRKGRIRPFDRKHATGRKPTPLSVAESGRIHLGPVRSVPSEAGAFWIWAAADRLALDPAENAVRVAEHLLGVEQKRAR